MGTTMNSMAMENITDIRRKQHCCCLFLSCCSLCACCDDVADIVIFGQDDSHNSKDPWILRRIHNSSKVFHALTVNVQRTHKDWRLDARNMSRKANQLKLELTQSNQSSGRKSNRSSGRGSNRPKLKINSSSKGSQSSGVRVIY